MPRTKIQIDVSELQDAITQLEATRLFSSPHTLYQAIAETPWSRAMGATAIMFYLRVKEVNVDPDNPVIKMRVKPARVVKPRDPNDPSPSRSARKTGGAFPGIDILVDVFQGRGIEITGVEWLVASSQKSDAENRAIRLAWADLRDKLGLPKPIKKSGAPEAEDLVVPANKPEDGSGIPDGVLPDAMTTDFDPTIEVIEEMPDGSPISSQTVVPAAAPVPTRAVSSPVQVRPVQPRPMPVRSSVPPRPMPIPTGE